MALKLTLIMLGGAAGTLLRYLITEGMRITLGGGFPYGTLTVNVVGCLLIGVLGFLFTMHPPVRDHVPEAYRLAMMFGVLGGFTTFSSFGYDTLKLLQDGGGGAVKAALNVVLSNGLGLLAVWAGYRAAAQAAG